jgi:hypothetical protein
MINLYNVWKYLDMKYSIVLININLLLKYLRYPSINNIRFRMSNLLLINNKFRYLSIREYFKKFNKKLIIE